jgi:hypothetical protein
MKLAHLPAPLPKSMLKHIAVPMPTSGTAPASISPRVRLGVHPSRGGRQVARSKMAVRPVPLSVPARMIATMSPTTFVPLAVSIRAPVLAGSSGAQLGLQACSDDRHHRRLQAEPSLRNQ